MFTCVRLHVCMIDIVYNDLRQYVCLSVDIHIDTSYMPFYALLNRIKGGLQALERLSHTQTISTSFEGSSNSTICNGFLQCILP